MNSRNEILSRLKPGSLEMPPSKKWVRKYHDRADQFAQRLQAAKGEVHLESSFDEALGKLAELFEELQIKTVAADRDFPLDEADFESAFPVQTWHFAGKGQDFLQACAKADTGLTSAEFALVETGTLVLLPSVNCSRLTSLLPPIHFVLLPESRIIPSIFDWVKLLPEVLPSNPVLVSGPSKTADIEQTLVVGVHGPKRLIVIVYPDIPEGSS